jgi:hypothetical protein
MAFYEKQKRKQVTSGYKIKMSGLHHGLLAAAGGPGGLAVVEGLAEHGFDYGLAADVEFFSGGFEFFEHGRSEVDVYALDGLHHFAGVGEEEGDVFAVVG